MNDFRIKPRSVKAIQFNGGETQGLEVVRWLTKWDVEAEYWPGRNVAILPERIQIADGPTVYKDTWIVLDPRNRDVVLMTDAEFKRGVEPA